MMTTTEEQIAAWNRYAEAKRRADQTLKLEDGITAVRAWKEFANIFLEDGAMSLDSLPRNTVIFPLHKTRAPGGHLDR